MTAADGPTPRCPCRTTAGAGEPGPLILAVIAAALALCLWGAATCGRRVERAYRHHGHRPLLRVAGRLYAGGCLLSLVLMAAGMAALAAAVALTASIGWVATAVLVDAIATHQAAWDTATQDKIGSVLHTWLREDG